MRKTFNIAASIIGLLLWSLVIFAEEVSVDQAKKVAVNWLSHVSEQTFELQQIDTVYQVKTDESLSLYIVAFEPLGWAIIAASASAEPVVGYSAHTPFVLDELPVQIDSWFSVIGREIISSKSDSYYPENDVKERWKGLLHGDMNLPALKSGLGITVGPLLSSKWNQGRYYNEQAPLEPASTAGNGHVWIGCVATSMAQVMKYWSFPVSGLGQYSYTHPTYGIQSASFEEAVYDYAAMPNIVNSINAEIGKLSYHCAVSVSMNFGASGSGAYLAQSRDAMSQYFKYAPVAFNSSKNRWSDLEWSNLLKSEIDKGRPVIYSGYNLSYTAGHAWVCDGYNDTHFHFNWGWGGSADGFYLLSALKPGGANYTNAQEATFGIEPIQPSSMTYPYVESFESGSTGKFSITGVSSVVNNFANSGMRSVRLSKPGFVSVADNSLWLTFLVPEQAQLSFWVKRTTPVETSRNNQKAALYSQWGNSELVSFFNGSFNDSTWVNYFADLSAHAGQIIRLQITQSNTDLSKDQWMYVDDLSITGLYQNLAPYEPSNPIPANNQLNVEHSPMLRWTGGDPNGDDVLYNIYLSTSNPPAYYKSTYDRFSGTPELVHKTKHFWKVVASDGENEVHSPIWNFTTQGIPPIAETCEVSQITDSSAMLCANLITDNGSPVTEKGVLWRENALPYFGHQSVIVDPLSNPSSGLLTGLKPYRNYFVQAYALSDEGVGLGSVLSFVTNAALPEVALGNVDHIKRTSALVTGLVTDLNDSLISLRGLEWSVVPDFTPGTGNIVAEAGTWDNAHEFTIEANNLPGPDTIYYRIFAQNSIGRKYSDQWYFVTINSAPFIDLDADNSSGIEGNRFLTTCYEQKADCPLADTDAHIGDIDMDTIKVVTIELLNPVHVGREYLVFNYSNQRLGVSGVNTTRLTLTNLGGIGNHEWTQILQKVSLMIDHDAPNTRTIRQVGFVANDGLDNSAMAIAFVNIKPVNDPPVNMKLPEIVEPLFHGAYAKATKGIWADTLDQCTGIMSISYQWQMRVDENSEVANIESIGADSLMVNELMCSGEIRVKEIVTDSYCGGENTATAYAYSNWAKVEKRNQTIVFDQVPNFKYGNGPYVLSGSSSSGFPLTYYGPSTHEPVFVQNDSLFITGVGNGVVAAYQSGNQCFYPSEYRYRSFKVDKGDQAISFVFPSIVNYSSQKIPVNAESNSGMNVVFRSSNTQIAYVENDSLVIAGTGLVTITAEQTGNSLYHAAQPVHIPIEVKKGEQIIQINAPSEIRYPGSAFLFEVTINSGLSPILHSSDESIIKIEDGLPVVTGVGVCTITVGQAENELWEAAPLQQFVITVLKGLPQLSVVLPDLVYGQGLVYPQVISSSEGEFVIQSKDTSKIAIDGNALDIKNAGLVELLFVLPENIFWQADSVQLMATVHKASQQIYFDSIADIVFSDGLLLPLIASSSSELPVSFKVLTPQLASVDNGQLTILGAGNVVVEASQAGNSNWESANAVVVSVIVDKAVQTLVSELPDTVTNNVISIPSYVYASSGLPVQLYSKNQNVISVCHDSLCVEGLGMASIEAVQLGNQNYKPITRFFQVVVIEGVAKRSFENVTFNLFPNPASEKVHLSIEGNTRFPLYLSVMNQLGEVVCAQQIGKTFSIVNINNLLSGVYHVVIQNDEFYETRKLIVK